MKRIAIILIFVFLPLYFWGQSGDGTSGSPFYGTISGNVQWSDESPHGSTIYVGTASNNDLTIGSGGHLTIDPGITVIFTQLTSDLIITGTGILTAEGTSDNLITFTKAADKSHWGHISFETPGSPTTPIDGTGSFSYCIIEYGYAVASGGNPQNMGGGIQVFADDVTIENCSFTGNLSTYGGAISVNSNRNTEVKNCVFSSNHANEAGGALLLRDGTSSVVENSIFEQNSCSGSYSGGAIWLWNNTSDIINCTFAENTSDYAGDAIYALGPLTGSIIINSIFWGSNDQFAGSNNLPTLTYCAFETSKPSNATNSIIISDVANDHFTDAGSGDWSLKFISPCRDAGVNTYTGVTIPSTDYDGNVRVWTKDIGAYEVYYSRWTGTTSTAWATATNWDASVSPAIGNGDVLIPTGLTNYPNVTTTEDFTVNTGRQLVLEPKTSVTLDVLTNNGTINLNSDETGMFSLMFSSYFGSGTVNSEIYFTGGHAPAEAYKWHYMAVPKTMAKTVMTNIDPYNLLRYDDSRITTTKEQGWQWHDGWNGTITVPADAFSTLDETRGYNFYHSSNVTATLTSTSLLSTIGQVNLQYSGPGSYASLYGFNLVGNSLTCALDWANVTRSASVRNAVYYTKNNALCAWVNGVGVNGGTQYIPPLQGFFVKTTATGQYITLTNAKVHATSQSYYKKGVSTSDIPVLRMEINQGEYQDEMVMRFEKDATDQFDDQYDASKWISPGAIPQIYTSLAGEDYCINSINYPETSKEIPIAIKIPADGNYIIRKTNIVGLEDYNFYLKDLLLNNTVNLLNVPVYSFTATTGTTSDRFLLIVSNIATGTKDVVISEKEFNIYYSFNMLNIQTLNDSWDGKQGFIKVFDLTGKTVIDINNAEFDKNSLIQVAAPGAKGLYMVEIRSGVKRYVGKVIIK